MIVKGLCVVGGILLFSACPLPYEFSGEGASGSLSRDPSSPDVTAPVTVSYSQASGPSGSIANGLSTTTVSDTTITLSTETENATVYYRTDGAPITSFGDANRIDGSEGTLQMRIANPGPGNNTLTYDITAVAVGPGMYPSPPVTATVNLDYFTPPRVIISDVTLGDITRPQATADVLLYALQLDVEGDGNVLEEITLRVGGTAANNDIKRLQVWLSDDASYDPTDFRFADLLSDEGFGNGSPVSVTGSGELPPGRHYLLVTTSVDGTATPGATLFVEGVSLADFQFQNETDVDGPGTLAQGRTVTFTPGSDTFEKVDSIGFSGIRYTYSNIRINGAATRSATVPLGQPVSLSFDLTVTNSGLDCPGCIVQAYIGFRSIEATCRGNFSAGSIGNSTEDNGLQLSFTPQEPGLYFLTGGGALQLQCLSSPERRISYFDSDQIFAVITAE